MSTCSDYAARYLEELTDLLARVEVTEGERNLSFEEGVERAIGMIDSMRGAGGKVMLIGNGASAAISSHQAADFIRAAGIRAQAFNDAPLLTCLGNDLGYERTFDIPIGLMAEPRDILITISSSGASPNILAGTEKGREVGCGIVGLSGFAADNPLRCIGDLNFYVPSESYGKVEAVHLSILHCVCDYLAGR